MHARLHRAQPDLQRLGDLRVREPFDLVQEKGRAVKYRAGVPWMTASAFSLPSARL